MAFFTALTGINASNAQLSTTSNNIANAATTGFKRSTTNFGDIFASSPLQKSSSTIGQGVSLKGVTQDFSQGNLTFSSDTLNLAISGDGFFPMKSSDGLQNIYTRNGTFLMNDQNNVVNSAGQTLMAASVDSAGNADISNMNPLNIPLVTKGEAKQTTSIQLGLNFPANATIITKAFNRNDPTTYNESTAMNVYDAAGNSYLATVYYAKTQNASQASPNNRWQTYVYVGNTLVSSALQQSTDASGSAQYVNQYGQIENAAQVGDQLTNSKTQMFNLDDLTNTQSSVAATVSGTLAPNLGTLSSDVVNFLNADTQSGITAGPLFDISVNGSKTVPISIADLAGQNLQLHGSEIATELTNRINQAFGSQKYFNFSGTNTSTVNLMVSSGSGAGSSTQNIPLNLGSGNETYQTVVQNINSQLQAAAASTPAPVSTLSDISFNQHSPQAMTLEVTTPNTGVIQLSIPASAKITSMDQLANYINTGYANLPDSTQGQVAIPMIPGYKAVKFNPAVNGSTSLSGSQLESTTAISFVSTDPSPTVAAANAPTFASVSFTDGTSNYTYNSKSTSLGLGLQPSSYPIQGPITLEISSGTSPSIPHPVNINQPDGTATSTPVFTSAQDLVNYLNTGSVALTPGSGTSLLPSNIVASVGLDGSTINFGSNNSSTPVPSLVTMSLGSNTYSSAVTSVKIPDQQLNPNLSTRINITYPPVGTATPVTTSLTIAPGTIADTVASLNGPSGPLAPLGLVASLGQDGQTINFGTTNSAVVAPASVTLQNIDTTQTTPSLQGTLYSSQSTSINEIQPVSTSSSTVTVTTSKGVSTVVVPAIASGSVADIVKYLNTGISSSTAQTASTDADYLAWSKLGITAVAGANGSTITFEPDPANSSSVISAASITTGSGNYASAVTAAYDPVAQQFNFTPTNSNQSLTLNGAIVNGAPVANPLFGLSTGSLTQSSTSTSLGVSASAEGSYIMDPADQRYGITVTYDSVNQKFDFASGTTGDKSSIALSNASSWAQSVLGLAPADSNGNAINYSVAPSATAIRGLESTPAQMLGGDIGVNVNNSFSVDTTNNTFVVAVGSVQGTITLPPSSNYTLGTFMQALQDGINHLSAPPAKPGLTGQTVSGVVVSYDAASNALKFTTGTTGSQSYIKVSGNATWGLANTTGARGVDSTWIKPTQATVLSAGVAVPQYIDQFGNETSSPDGFATLPAWSPIYLGKGELTFDTSGSLVSPKVGTQLNTVYLPNGAGSLTMNINYSKSTQNSTPYAVLSESQDGAPEGSLTGVSIGSDGLVTASYSNSTQAKLGKIVLANFSNPSGLTQIGNTNYYSSSASGTVKYAEAGSAGYGTIQSGATENANVDMTKELVALITEQRNFQANAKAISTDTTLTQTIIQIQA